MPILRSDRLNEAPPGCPLTGFGIARMKKGVDPGLELHFHDGDEFWFLVEGRVRVLSEGEEYVLHPGEALYTPAGQDHTILEVVEDAVVVWMEGELKGRRRPGHLHRPHDPWP